MERKYREKRWPPVYKKSSDTKSFIIFLNVIRSDKTLTKLNHKNVANLDKLQKNERNATDQLDFTWKGKMVVRSLISSRENEEDHEECDLKMIKDSCLNIWLYCKS